MDQSEEVSRAAYLLRSSPSFFAEVILGLVLYPYQAELLECVSKRVVACWARQTGKTTAIAVKVVHFAFSNAGSTTLIVSRGLRQSMIMFGVIERFVLVTVFCVVLLFVVLVL